MPTVKTIPAMPGSVSVAPTEHRTPSVMMMLLISAIFATSPANM